MRTLMLLAFAIALPAASLAACSSDGENDSRLLVVTTVSPLRSIVENVGGDRIRVVGIVPEGTDSHTFEPPPSAVRDLAAADLIILNGLQLEEPSRELAAASKQESTRIVMLGDSTISPSQYVYDFSFPVSGGKPNPHLWTDPLLAASYASLVAGALASLDSENADYYRANSEAFGKRIGQLDAAIRLAVDTVPASQRKLLTYHDSFPFFASRYGFEVIGAIQPSDFSEPSAQDLARLIDQIRRSQVPAIFGSEVFPSKVLEQIADEAGAVQVDTLRDDDLPGEPGDSENTYFGLMVSNAETVVSSLGGDASSLNGFDTTNTFIPFTEFTRAP